jgi:hypothetical protein
MSCIHQMKVLFGDLALTNNKKNVIQISIKKHQFQEHKQYQLDLKARCMCVWIDIR